MYRWIPGPMIRGKRLIRMRLWVLALGLVLSGTPGLAQSGQSSTQGDDASLPVSLDHIKKALAQPPAQPLRGLDEVPHFRVEIQERQKIDDLLDTLKFDSGPAVPGGLYGYEQQQLAFPKTSDPLMQPFAAFNQGELLTVAIENLLAQYIGPKMLRNMADASRQRAEQAAREEVQRALAEFCAVHDCPPQPY